MRSGIRSGILRYPQLTLTKTVAKTQRKRKDVLIGGLKSSEKKIESIENSNPQSSIPNPNLTQVYRY